MRAGRRCSRRCAMAGGANDPGEREPQRFCTRGTAVKTFDRYVLNKTLMPLTVAIGIALIALLMERLVRLPDLVVNKGGPFYLLLQMLANLIPHYLSIALSAAFFIGVLHAGMKMSSASEQMRSTAGRERWVKYG